MPKLDKRLLNRGLTPDIAENFNRTLNAVDISQPQADILVLPRYNYHFQSDNGTAPVTWFMGDTLCPVPEGAQVTVLFDNQTYLCAAKAFYEDGIAFGNLSLAYAAGEDTGEPFAALSYTSGREEYNIEIFVEGPESSDHVVQISYKRDLDTTDINCCPPGRVFFGSDDFGTIHREDDSEATVMEVYAALLRNAMWVKHLGEIFSVQSYKVVRHEDYGGVVGIEVTIGTSLGTTFHVGQTVIA